MTYPITEERFIAKWLGAIDDPDEADKKFAVALVAASARQNFGCGKCFN